ncbi:MAG: NlpC/P60 family protein [Planctomycetota bacterium]
MSSGHGLLTVTVILLGIGTVMGGAPIDKTIQAAIDEFGPLWSPPAGELTGWVIGIDPVDADGPNPSQRTSHLNMLTAGHLYHFVQKAGGRPVLTRVDDTLATADPSMTRDSRATAAAAANCDLCISIRFEPKPGSGDADILATLRSSESTTHTIHFACDDSDQPVDVAARHACHEHARRLYQALSQYCADRKPASADGGQSFDFSGPTAGSRLERLGRSIWPAGDLPPKQLDWFCRAFSRAAIANQSLVYFDVTAAVENDIVVIRGRTNTPVIVSGLMETLQGVGFEQVRSEVQSLPDHQRLGQQLFGVCRVPMAMTYDQPGGRGRPQTQLLFGEPVFLMQAAMDDYLLHGGDGYWGWVNRAAIQRITTDQFNAYMQLPEGIVMTDVAVAGTIIPRGSRVRVTRQEPDQCFVLMPDDTRRAVPAEFIKAVDRLDTASARVRAALDLLYVPYVFGGRSPVGLDCSGLTANVWTRTGLQPPRDAWQQAFAGALVATPWHQAAIQPGDQIFFIDRSGKTYHTGVALGAGYFVHAAPPCVQIGSLNSDDPLYDEYSAQTFFIAKRP